MKIRKPECLEKNLKELETESDLKRACAMLINLVNTVNCEKEIPIEFDSKTGKPIKFEWVEHERYGNKFSVGGEHYGGTIDVIIKNNILDDIKKKPVLITIDGKDYICRFDKIDHSGNGYDGYYHCIEYAIFIEEINKL